MQPPSKLKILLKTIDEGGSLLDVSIRIGVFEGQLLEPCFQFLGMEKAGIFAMINSELMLLFLSGPNWRSPVGARLIQRAPGEAI